jgi:carboxypeptidase D
MISSGGGAKRPRTLRSPPRSLQRGQSFLSVSCFLLLLVVVAVIVDGVRIHPNRYHYRDGDGDAVVQRLLWSRAHVPTEHEVWAMVENGINATAFSSSSSEQRRRTQSVNVAEATSPHDHLVQNLPLLQDGVLSVEHWAGHLPASANGDKYFFYWLFAPDLSDSASRDDNAAGSAIPGDDIPLLIWLNGGPGCSSMDGLFLENGPLQWSQPDPNTKQYHLQANPYSWHKAPAYTLYIDQPVGTGLSFTTDPRGYPTNDEKVNVDFYYFLQSFLTLHADKFVHTKDDDQVLALRRPLYFSGESHAGHYIPSMIHYILQQNDKKLAKNVQIGVNGAAIGNGWMDPFHQYAAAEAAFGHGIVGRAQVAALQQDEHKCQAALQEQQYRSGICFALLDNVVDESHGSTADTRVSQYDVRVSEHKNAARNFPYGHKIVETYLGGFALSSGEHNGGTMDASISTSVLQALHATAATAAGQRYEECTDPPYNALSQWDGLGVVPDIIAILQHSTKPRLLFFNGIQDLICNHVGNEKALENMEWQYQTKWIQAQRYAWISTHEEKDKVSGYVKEFQNLLFLKLLNGGHMVPMDIPAVALDMMQVFMQTSMAASTSFDSSLQNLKAKTPADGGAGAGAGGTSCPDCPTCSSGTTDDATNGDDDTSAAGSDEIYQSKTPAKGSSTASSSSSRLPWMLVFVLTVAVAVASLLLCRKHGVKEKVEYSLELRNVKEGNARYSDDEPDDDNENGNENGHAHGKRKNGSSSLHVI